MADYLQANMKKLCEDNENKITIYKENPLNNINYSKLMGNLLWGTIEQAGKDVYSQAVGTLSEMGIEILSSPFATISGLTNLAIGGSYEVAVDNFNITYTNPIRDNIKDSVPNQNAYVEGAKKGNAFVVVGSIATTIMSVGNIFTLNNNGNLSLQAVLSEGQTATIVSDGTVAISTNPAAIIGATGGTTTANNNKPASNTKYNFKTKELLDEHYQKHVVDQNEFGNISKQKYL